jgi:hypothetical protein
MSLQRVTRLQFRTDLKGRIGQPVFWPDSQLNATITEVLREWNLLTGYWTSRMVIPVTAGNHLIELPSTLTAAAHAEYLGQHLAHAGLDELDYSVPTWQSQASSTPNMWVHVGLDTIILHPAADFSGNQLVIDGMHQTPKYDEDTDYIDLSESLFQVLLDYARHLLLFSIGGPWFEESMSARKAFILEASKFNDRVKDIAPLRSGEVNPAGNPS